MYYYKVVGNYVCKYKISYDVCDIQKYLYCLLKKYGKKVRSSYVTLKPKRISGKIYSDFNVKYFGYDKDYKPLYEVDAVEVIKPELYKLIESILNGDNDAIINLYKYKVSDGSKFGSMDYFYIVFQECFKFSLVDKMNVDEYNKAREFMGLSLKISNSKKRGL